ncbi:hypothetical protein BS78_01G195400 [Paspalum vaginatum]|nr:hypothetical protein BS78_01G195400 [Paspalum vaginatum]
MASPKPSTGLSSPLLILLLATAAAGLRLEPAGTSRRFPPLLDCAPAPAQAQAQADTSSNNSSAFRANVLSLLGALPSAAAAAPRGSTAALSGGSGRDRAFARGLCLGVGGDCLACLSAAAQDVARGCGAATRRAGVWRAGCFLSYADTNASTAREDAFGGWFYDDADDAALESQSQCAANRTAAECARCLDASAQVVPRLREENQLSFVHGDAVVVVGYGCYVRVPLFPPMPLWQLYVLEAIGALELLLPVLVEVGVLLYCFKIARELNPMPA